MIKQGDKVRFLNAVGGGTVKRFKNKDIVIVEEDDGFETPALIRECIVIEQNGNRPESARTAIIQPEVRPSAVAVSEKKHEIVETPTGDRLNVYIAYLPMDIKQIGKCNYEAYFINDSNYFVFFNYMSRQNGAWTSRHTETAEPNTHLFIEEFTRERINDLETVCVQLIAFKRDRPFSLKNAFSVELRIDGVKFYKLHCFVENDFFEDDALIYPVVENDVPYRKMLISADELKEAMILKNSAERPKNKAAKKDKTTEIIEVDLHIGQLLDTTRGMSNKDMLDYQLDVFRRTMDENRTRKGQKIVFIHGKGEGVLKLALLDELKRKYPKCAVQDASFLEYGFGATMVTVR
jgi:hypothetical protein